MLVANLKNIFFSYDDASQPVLHNLDFYIEKEEHVVLLGCNGSGKSTLAKLVAGLMSPNSGEVNLLTHRCFDNDSGVDADSYREARRHIACVFQDPADQLVSDTVAGDVAFGPQNLMFEVSEIDEAVETQLEKAGIGSFARRDPATLSGGEQQLVAIASAISMKPQLLVLDEPSAFLDDVNTGHLLRLIEKASQGIAILHVTHNSIERKRADRVVDIEEINR